MAEVKVRVVKSTMVKPARPSPQKTLSLNALDLMIHHFPHNRRFLFYKLNSVEQYSRFLQDLSSSLPEVLAYFYPLAGRFRKLREPQPGVSNCSTRDPPLEVDCNDEGVPFMEAVVDGICFDELQRSGFPHHDFYNDLVPWIDPQDYCISPPLIIQVSRFECGSVALAIAASHILCDGHSLWHFLTSWAECARGEPISRPPLHKRDFPKIDIPEKEKTTFFLENDDNEGIEDHSKSDVKLKIFCFTKESIKRLKIKAGGQRTSYESLCAHIWKHTNKARGLMRDKRVCFITVINMRQRMNPPLGEDYFGNAVIWTSVVATSGEIEDEDLETIANRIHLSIQSCNALTFSKWFHWGEVYDRDAIVARGSFNGTRLRVSSSPRFPVFNVDFGSGKPLVARCVGVEGSGKLVLYPSSDLESVEVSIMLPSNIMEKLENNIGFIDP